MNNSGHSTASDGIDEFLWLEEVDGERALAWVTEANKAAESALTQAPGFASTKAAIREVTESDARIPMATERHGQLYNFWTDGEHPRGLWRRTTWESYRTDAPDWDVLLDLDALGEEEGEKWVWHGASVRRTDYARALVVLSPGGSDAHVIREFDMATRTFVSPEDGGFYLPESKGSAAWLDDDTILFATDMGEGSMSKSGYPLQVHTWQRGTDKAAAQRVYTGQPGDMGMWPHRDHTEGFERTLVMRMLAFYEREVVWLPEDGEPVVLDVPLSADVDFHREWVLVTTKEPWQAPGAGEVPAGTFLAAPFEDVVAGTATYDVLFRPTDSTILRGAWGTRHHLLLTLLDDVRHRLVRLTHTDQGWQSTEVELGGDGDRFQTIGTRPVDDETSDAVWLTTNSYLQPTTLSLLDLAGETFEPEPLKSAPAFFDTDGLITEQRWATSNDGTKVPYFVIRREDCPMDGTTPTILYGYGGFEVALTPSYNASTGLGWLRHGGAYVVANIRGGGEFGPGWHRGALHANRHRAYEDFTSVAKELVEIGLTTPERLGTTGRSNGGLLMGVMMTLYGDLFGAIACGVPLLDMQRYHLLLAGHSWIAEYGDPDKPEQWEYLQTFSPYQLFDADRPVPPVYFFTSTKDDRVHPGHARKMAAKMAAAGKDVLAYENLEGGHAGSSTGEQLAHMEALVWTFFARNLGLDLEN